jgi:Glycosyl hydrolases family 2, TIM barrel domain/Glycosyl hydrolases family 2, sugar binding domain/Glycosyl hydrolases family 2
MPRINLVPIAALFLISAAAPAQEWKPAKGPLMTKWAADVRPDKGPPLPEYPRPQLVRERWLNLNGVWQFAFAKADEAAPVGKDLDKTILVPFPVESALSGVMKPAERVWYRRTFAVPKEWGNQRVLLHFGAVDWEATVYVNGKKVGSHRGGFDPFSFNITDALKKQEKQEIIVGVYDPTDKGPQPRGKQVGKPGGIYYTPTTGIWQTVWLEPVPTASIAGLDIFPHVDEGEVHVHVGISTGAGKVRVTAKLRGKAVAAVTRATSGGTIALEVGKGNLWSPDSPTLYDLSVELLDGDKVVDRVDSYFGMRKIEVKPAVGKEPPRILLNGKPIFQMGVLDQGFWPDGLYTAPTDEALKYDIELTKKLGFNMSRKHVKVEPARWYYWCDKLGLLVWQDMPSGERGVDPGKPDLVRTKESAAIYETELKAMIDGLHNHPCIVSWVIFNEGWGQYDTARMAAWTKKHDPTRLVNSASGWNDRKVGDVHDVHVYPGPGAPPVEAKRAGVLGEFGGLGLAIKGHTWSKETWGYRGVRDKAELTRKYERLVAGVYDLQRDKGLNAAVYTQLTDVETEANGLVTYDRAVLKVDVPRVAAVNRGDVSRVPAVVEVVPTSRAKAQTWSWTLDKPAERWAKPDFEAKTWKSGPGGFGTKGTPGAVVRTEWKTSDIWIRRAFDLPKGDGGEISLLMHHDDDVEVYLNGVLALKVVGYTGDYEEFALPKAALEALKPGKNVIAIHCHQHTGGQYIDAGLIRFAPRGAGK